MGNRINVCRLGCVSNKLQFAIRQNPLKAMTTGVLTNCKLESPRGKSASKPQLERRSVTYVVRTMCYLCGDTVPCRATQNSVGDSSPTKNKTPCRTPKIPRKSRHAERNDITLTSTDTMGLDIHVGSLTHYYCGDWETIVDTET